MATCLKAKREKNGKFHSSFPKNSGKKIKLITVNNGDDSEASPIFTFVPHILGSPIKVPSVAPAPAMLFLEPLSSAWYNLRSTSQQSQLIFQWSKKHFLSHRVLIGLCRCHFLRSLRFSETELINKLRKLVESLTLDVFANLIHRLSYRFLWEFQQRIVRQTQSLERTASSRRPNGSLDCVNLFGRCLLTKGQESSHN